eukprot:2413281-Pyramimonas_sp.AAC.1
MQPRDYANAEPWHSRLPSHRARRWLAISPNETIKSACRVGGQLSNVSSSEWDVQGVQWHHQSGCSRHRSFHSKGDVLRHPEPEARRGSSALGAAIGSDFYRPHSSMEGDVAGLCGTGSPR